MEISVRMKTRAAFLLAAVAGTLAVGSPAFAAAGIVDGPASSSSLINNVSVLPVQVCDSEVDVISVEVPVVSPDSAGDCTNGTVGDAVGQAVAKPHAG
jgi:hypothetical protein